MTDSINSLIEEFEKDIETFKKTYLLSNQYPRDKKLSNALFSINTQIKNLTDKVTTMANNIQKKNSKAETDFYETKDKIAIEKNKNEQLNSEWQQIKGQYQGAEEMVRNYRMQYQWLQMSIVFFVIMNVILAVFVWRMKELKVVILSMNSSFFKQKIMEIFNFITKTVPTQVAGPEPAPITDLPPPKKTDDTDSKTVSNSSKTP